MVDFLKDTIIIGEYAFFLIVTIVLIVKLIHR